MIVYWEVDEERVMLQKVYLSEILKRTIQNLDLFEQVCNSR